MSDLALSTWPSADGHMACRLETHPGSMEAGKERSAQGGLGAVASTAITRRAGVATGTLFPGVFE
jgi:hypothetical protein